MTFEDILKDTNDCKLALYEARQKTTAFLKTTERGKDIQHRLKLVQIQRAAAWTNFEHANMAFQNYKGRNLLKNHSIYKELFNEDIAGTTDKHIILQEALREASTKYKDIRMDEVKHNAEFSDYIAPYITEIEVAAGYAHRAANPPAPKSTKLKELTEYEIQYLKQVEKLVTRLKNGGYRDKKAMIAKVVRAYSRCSGDTMVKYLVGRLSRYYGEELFKIEE
jgi:hypothetical protein